MKMQFNKEIKRKLMFYLLIGLIFFIDLTIEDLPVHCLKHEIIGKWVIKASDLYPVSSGHKMKCGHSEPSSEETSWLSKSPIAFKNEYILDLKEVDTAYIQINSQTKEGRWTMVYDEGFNIDFNDLSFFAFSKYEIKKSIDKTIFNSKCFSTCVGWYHNNDKTQWGCYQAFKLNENPNKITTYNTKNSLNIVEPTVKKNENFKNQNGNINNYNNSNVANTKNILDAVMNMQFKSIGSEIIIPDKDTNSENIIIKNKKKINFRKNPLNTHRNKNRFTSFIQSQTNIQEKSMLRLDATFRNHALYVSKLHEVKKNWSAGVDPNFAHMTIRELNKFAGNKSYKTNSRNSITNQKNNKEDISKFPKKFDWKHILKPAGSQGNCGSCYAYSTSRMIEARLKLKFNHDVNLSVQHSLDCSIYNQGCEGGYPFLVMKFANEYELIPEFCKPYMESTGKCMENTCNIKTLPHIYRAKNYRYVGGSYGQCSQKKMMEELIKNGPIVVSFEPDYNFMLYKSGIYHALDEKTWMENHFPKPEWEKVDHSVLLVGWGEDDFTKEKYWIIQNTWGPNWGENGFFRMKRGSDEYGIESICEAADPYIIDNFTGKEILSNILDHKYVFNSDNKKNFLNMNSNYMDINNDNLNSNRNDNMSNPIEVVLLEDLNSSENKSIFDEFN